MFARLSESHPVRCCLPVTCPYLFVRKSAIEQDDMKKICMRYMFNFLDSDSLSHNLWCS